MNIKQLLAVMSIATAFCWLAWAGVLTQFDPTQAGFVGFLLFYSSLFGALLGTFFLASFAFRKIFTRFVLEYRIVSNSFRQSFFFALLVVGCLFFQHLHLLTWWNILLLIAGVTIVEFLFLSARKTV